jgi:hypothetical protein
VISRITKSTDFAIKKGVSQGRPWKSMEFFIDDNWLNTLADFVTSHVTDSWTLSVSLAVQEWLRSPRG